MINNACLASQSTWHFIPSDVNALHSLPADNRIFYGNGSLQFGDLRLPKNISPPYPVAIIIHGGCWVSSFADLQNTAALADAIRDMGIATWNIEYRREDNKGGGWPGTFEDIAKGADFLNKIANKYSLDLKRVIVIGQSAGGHLALWLASRHRLPADSQLYVKNPIVIKGVIAMGGVPDLKAYRQHGEAICGSDVIGKLLGESSTEINNHLPQSSPVELLPLGIPQILIYGTDDQAVPYQFGKDYTESAMKKGDSVKLISVKYAGHHEYNVPNSVTWPYVHDAIIQLLKK